MNTYYYTTTAINHFLKRLMIILMIIIIKKKCFLSTKSRTRMISEGPGDTEDWSNDADNSALPGIHYLLK